MAKLGEITEFCNAEEFRLDTGANTYVTLQDLTVSVGNLEDRASTNDSGADFFSGFGDNFFAATLKLTHPEFSSLNTLSQKDSDGKLTSTAWLIIGIFLDGTSKTMAATGVLRNYVVRKGLEGKVLIDIFVRITGDTVAIT